MTTPTPPRHLAIDRGNTFAKAGLFEGSRLVGFWEQLDDDALRALVAQQQPARLMACDVRGQVAQVLQPWAQVLQVLHWQMPVPLRNLYQTPQTLGMDRLAAAIGAWALFPGHDCLVIDAGTCITYDFVSARGEFHGGSIAPGLRMRLAAMHQFTAKLPMLEIGPHEQPPLTGSSTREAMLSGAVHGLCAEIEGFIARYQALSPHLQVILCGGDALFFEKKIKQPNFVSQKLVVEGLNQVLLHHL